MIKLIGVIILSVAVASTGFYAGSRVRKRVELLNCCIRLVRSFSVDIGYCSEPVKVMIKKAAVNREFAPLCFLNDLSKSDLTDFSSEWKKSIGKFSVISTLDKNDIQLLESFGERLGTTDSSFQTQLCNEYIQLFEERYESAKVKLPEHLRLCRVGGAVCGLAVLILLL